MTTLLLVNALATWALAGLIWTIQLVHYPLMRRVGAPDFAAYHAGHVRAIGPLVGPLMAFEVATALPLAFIPVPGVPAIIPGAGLALVAVNLVATASLSVPEHRRLATGTDPAALRRLVATNWVRTLGWSARALLLGVALDALLRGA